MRPKRGLVLALVLATVGPARLAHAGSFGGFGAGGMVLDDDTRACDPLIVGPDGVATGRPRCQAVAAAERGSFKKGDPAPAGWDGSVKRRALVVTRGGRKVVTWTAPQDLERVVAVHVGEGGAVVAVEAKTRNGTLLVAFRLAEGAGGGGKVAPGGQAGPGGPAERTLPMDIAEGTWRQPAVPCEQAGVTLELTATRYSLVIETRCQTLRDKLKLAGVVRPGKLSPIELVLENDGGPEEAWPCAPKPCAGGAMCLACSDGEDGFELTRDPKSGKAKKKAKAPPQPKAAPSSR